MKNKLIYCSIFAALTAVFSQIVIPLPFTPVPINLALLSVLICGGLLGAKYAALSQTVYVLLGAIGAPVFANFSGGLGILTGLTGGFAIGYILTAFIVGLLFDKNQLLSMVLGVLSCYTLGVIWFSVISGNNILNALMLCVVPFLAGDILKICAAVYFVTKLKRFVKIN